MDERGKEEFRNKVGMIEAIEGGGVQEEIERTAGRIRKILEEEDGNRRKIEAKKG